MAKSSDGSLRKTKINGKQYWVKQVTIGYDDNGKQKRKSFYGATRKEAIEKYESWKSKQSFASNDDLTLGQYFHTWLFEIRKMELKSSTFERYYGIYENYIISNKKLSSTKLTDITNMQIQIYFNSLLKEGKPVTTVKNVNRYIKTFFEDCVKEGLMVRNPCNNIKFPKNNDVEEDDQFIFLTDEEQRELIKNLSGDPMELVILLGLMCGMRLGEILALEYTDFDFNEGWININKSIKRVSKINENGEREYLMEITKPKTKAGIRKCPLPTFLVPKIKQQNKINLENKLKSDIYCNSNLLFCNADGTPIDTKKPNRRLKTLCKKLGLNENIHFHSLRSIFISNCVNKDIDIKTLMSWVGHAEYSTTMNIYARIKKEKLQESSNLVNSIFADIL